MRALLLTVLVCGFPLAHITAQPLLTAKPVFIGNPNDRFFPVDARSLPNQPNKMVMVSSEGRIVIIDTQTNQKLAQPFLNLRNIDPTRIDQRVSSIAFHPDYANNGKFYLIKQTSPRGENQEAPRAEIMEFRVSPDNPFQADPTSGRTLLSAPAAGGIGAHSWNWLDFSPQDGMLYVAVGDLEEPSHSQNLDGDLAGKILRIDVNRQQAGLAYAIPRDNPFVGRSGDDEIWSHGLRNPWRNSFDRKTGDLYIADVGEDSFEEINFQPANSTGGQNYGWPAKEGPIEHQPGLQNAVGPTYFYPHTTEQNAVIGGHVYRGTAIGAGMEGVYVFGDVNGKLFSLRHQNGKVDSVIDLTKELWNEMSGGLQTLAQDAQGEVYFFNIDKLYKIVAVPAIGDSDLDGDVDLIDFISLRNHFGQSGDQLPGDTNRDGAVDIGDFILLRKYFGTNSRTQQQAAAVPEPGHGILLLIACGMLIGQVVPGRTKWA